MHYTDYAVARFLDAVRGRPWFDRTLFVILGDHAIWNFPDDIEGRELTALDKTEIYTRAGVVIWAPGLVPTREVATLGSQIDLAPTILDLLGIRDANAFQGVSLFADVPSGERFAVMVSDSSWSIREGDRYCYDLGQSCFADAEPKCLAGARPEPGRRSCFRYAGDLLASRDDRESLQPLGEEERDRVIAHGERLIAYNRALIAADALMPPDVRSAADATDRSRTLSGDPGSGRSRP
jgi:hypothetical protein